ncbi:MAG: iron-sulfur cluster-binding protein [Chloroflexi bacterium RBG_13_56_8]|nr:MAG: iron-sulfur cluster-binding protein [Chloroflexi bacterium RBG_13_56_8]
MSTRPVVAVLKTTPESVLEDYDRLLGLAEVEKYLPADVPVILKDNISWHYPFPSANTTPWQLEGTTLALRNRGYHQQVCVQNKTVVTNAFKGEDLNNYVPIFQRYDIPVLYNFHTDDMRWVPFEPKAKMNILHHIYPKGIRIPDYFVGKSIVHLPTVKCHIYTTTTGAMKNAFGGLLATHRHYTHSWIHETLVDLLHIQKEIHSGVFAVMDGTMAGNGTGPRVMKPETKNVILASGDQVAIDAIAAKMMGFDPLEIGYIRLAHEQDLGVGDPREIEVVGDNISGENWHFRVGVNFHRAMGWLSWYGPTKVLQKLLFRTPLVHAFSLVSEAYHDWYRWPLKERHIYERWREENPWGRLFAEYQEKGHLR